MNWVIYCRLFNRSCLLGMQFRINSQQSSITLIFLGSLSLTLPLVGLYLYPYWTGKLDSKFFFFLEKKTSKAVFLPRLKFCGNLLKQKFPSFSLVTRTLFSTKVYQRHIRQDLRSGTTKRIIFTEYLFERSWLRSVQTWQACPRKGLSWNEEMFTRSVYTRQCRAVASVDANKRRKSWHTC